MATKHIGMKLLSSKVMEDKGPTILSQNGEGAKRCCVSRQNDSEAATSEIEKTIPVTFMNGLISRSTLRKESIVTKAYM
jgi:hypothetical protein